MHSPERERLQVRRIQGQRPPRVAQLAKFLTVCDVKPVGVRAQALQLDKTIARHLVLVQARQRVVQGWPR